MATSSEIELIAKWVQKYPNCLCGGGCDSDVTDMQSPLFVYYYLLIHPGVVIDYYDETGGMIPGTESRTGCSHTLSYNGLNCGRQVTQNGKCELHDNPIFSLSRFRQMETLSMRNN